MCKKLFAEFLGTFWLVFAGCGSAIFMMNGMSYPFVALAFGLSVMTMAYAVGHISGGHFNPAVSIGLFCAGRFNSKDLLPYILAQLAGGIVASFVLFLILSGKLGADVASTFSGVANGYAEHSPTQFNLFSSFLAEAVLTAIFLLIITGVTDSRAPAGFAPIAIGLGLTLILIVCIPITNASINPVRSIAPAIFANSWALGQVWLFIVAPIFGGAVGGFIYKTLFAQD